MNRLAFSLFVLVLFPALTFAQFEYRSNWRHPPVTFKPYIIKLTTPSGLNVVRDIPLDHLHHHGLMFAIKVDDVNFWEEYNPKDYGRQETTSIAETVTETNGHSVKKVESTLTWANGVGLPLVQEKRTITATRIGDANVLDWTSTFTLPPGKEKAVLGGNEYHGLGMRFVESMDYGKYFTPTDAGEKVKLQGVGHLTVCRWMAYTSKVGDKPVTLALFNTKDNPRPMLVFTMRGDDDEFGYLSATTNLYREPITLTSEKPVTFRYKIALWDGEKTVEEVEAIKLE